MAVEYSEYGGGKKQVGGDTYTLTLTGENIITLTGTSGTTSTITLPICTEGAIDTLFNGTTQDGLVIQFERVETVYIYDSDVPTAPLEIDRTFSTLTEVSE